VLAAPAVRATVAKALRICRKASHCFNFTANLFPIAPPQHFFALPTFALPTVEKPTLSKSDGALAAASHSPKSVIMGGAVRALCELRSRRACPELVEGTCSCPFAVWASPQSPPNHPFTSPAPVPKSQNRISLRNCGLIQPAGKRRHESNAKSGPQILPGSFTRSHDVARRSHRLPPKRCHYRRP
jgi:hypothetical protein